MSIHNIMFSWRNKKNINTFGLKKKGFLSRAMSIAYIFSGEIRKKKFISILLLSGTMDSILSLHPALDKTFSTEK